MIEKVSTRHVLTVRPSDPRELVVEPKLGQLPACAFLVDQNVDALLEIRDLDIRLAGSLKNGGEQKKRNQSAFHERSLP
jgi:hypothetical protein